MKYIMAFTAFALLTACEALENGPSYGSNPNPALIYAMGGGMRPWTPPQPSYVPPPMQPTVVCQRMGATIMCN